MKIYIKWSGSHDVTIYGKHIKKSSPEPEVLAMILKLGVEYRKVYSNDDHGLTLTYFMARSN